MTVLPPSDYRLLLQNNQVDSLLSIFFNLYFDLSAFIKCVCVCVYLPSSLCEHLQPVSRLRECECEESQYDVRAQSD